MATANRLIINQFKHARHVFPTFLRRFMRLTLLETSASHRLFTHGNARRFADATRNFKTLVVASRALATLRQRNGNQQVDVVEKVSPRHFLSRHTPDEMADFSLSMVFQLMNHTAVGRRRLIEKPRCGLLHAKMPPEKLRHRVVVGLVGVVRPRQVQQAIQANVLLGFGKPIVAGHAESRGDQVE